VKLRRKMNEQDTDANQKAIDSLLNYETVKYFSAEDREARRYDTAMAGYEAAALKTSYSLAFLNFGQAVIITGGLVGVMVLAAIGVQNGILSVGDFVLVNLVGASGDVTITLPAASSDVQVAIKIAGAANGKIVTVDGNGAQSIDGAATRTMDSDYESMHLISDGSNWWRIS